MYITRPHRSWYTSAGLVAIVLAGVGVRFVIAARWSFFADEQFSLRAALRGPAAAWTLAQSDLHPPLYNFLLSLWLPIAGAWPEWHARSLSILIALGWIILVYRVAARHLPTYATVVAALVVAVHPFAVQFSQALRWYGLFALLVTLSADQLERVLAGDRWRNRLGLSVALSLCAWCNLHGLVLAAVTVMLLFGTRRKAAVAVAVLTLFGTLPLAPWLEYLGDASGGLDRTGLYAGFIFKPALLVATLMAGGASYLSDTPTRLALGAFAVAIVAVGVRTWPTLRARPALLAWIPAVVVSLLVLGPFSAPQYYLFMHAPVALSVGWCTSLRLTAGYLAVGAYGVLAGLGLFNVLHERQMVRAEYTDPWRSIAARALAAAGAEGMIFTNAESLCLYTSDDPRCVRPLDDSATVIRAAGVTRRIVLISAPQSGMRSDAFRVERVIAPRLVGMGFRVVDDSVLVRADNAALRRRLADRPFPDARIRMLVLARPERDSTRSNRITTPHRQDQ